MTKALCGNNPEFVKLMMKNGINMSEYLDVEKLEELYSAVSVIFSVNLTW